MKPKTTMYVGLKPGEDPRVLLAGLVTPGSGLGGGGCALEGAPGQHLILTDGADPRPFLQGSLALGKEAEIC